MNNLLHMIILLVIVVILLLIYIELKNKNNNFKIPKIIFLILFITIFILFSTIVSYFITSTILIGNLQGNDWIGYLGSIVGGILTLLGVILTIMHEENIRKQNKRLEYKPILVLENGTVKPILEDKAINLSIELNNKGRGEAYNTFIEFEKINGYDIYIDYPENGNENKMNFPLFYKDCSKKMEIIITKNNKSSFDEETDIKGEIKIKYKGVFEENEITNIYNYQINVNPYTHKETNEEKLFWRFEIFALK